MPDRTAGTTALIRFCACSAVLSATDAGASVLLTLRVRAAGPGWVAALLAGVFVPAVVLAPAAGMLIDRLSARIVLGYAYTGEAVCALLLIRYRTPTDTVLLGTAHGVLLAATVPATLALVPALAPKLPRTHAYARFGVAVAIGQVIGALAGGQLAVKTDLVFGFESAACLLVGWAAISSRRATDRAPRPSLSDAVAGLRQVLRDPALRRAVPSAAIAQAIVVGCAVAAPFRLRDIAPGAAPIGTYQALLAAGILLGSQCGRHVIKGQFTARTGIGIGGSIMGAGYVGTGLVPTYPGMLTAAVVAGLGSGLLTVSFDSLVYSRAQTTSTGRTFAAAAAATALASGIVISLAIPQTDAGHAAWFLTGAGATAAAATAALIRPRRAATATATAQ